MRRVHGTLDQPLGWKPARIEGHNMASKKASRNGAIQMVYAIDSFIHDHKDQKDRSSRIYQSGGLAECPCPLAVSILTR